MDISMCLSDECDKANRCFRKTAVRSEIQSYFKPSVISKDCIYFWDNGLEFEKNEKENHA